MEIDVVSRVNHDVHRHFKSGFMSNSDVSHIKGLYVLKCFFLCKTTLPTMLLVIKEDLCLVTYPSRQKSPVCFQLRQKKTIKFVVFYNRRHAYSYNANHPWGRMLLEISREIHNYPLWACPITFACYKGLNNVVVTIYR
jgi:hypothetical protein